MQTFLPDPDFVRSAQVLDTQRVWKQVLEARTLLAVVQGTAAQKQRKDGTLYTPLEHYPATLMWKDYPDAFIAYFNAMLQETLKRGIRTPIQPLPLATSTPVLPPWLGHTLFHASHRSNLLRKNWTHYAQFGWTESTDMPYLWPIISSAPPSEYYTCYTRQETRWVLKPTQECAA